MALPTSSPTTIVNPWLVGDTTVIPIEFFDEVLIARNPIGPEADEVTLELFNYDCVTEVTDTTGAALSLSSISISNDISEYSVFFDAGNFASDTGGFVESDGHIGSVKWCTRVTSLEEDLKISFKETNFVLNYDLSDNGYDITNIGLDVTDPDEFTDLVDSNYSVEGCQCMDFFCMLPAPIKQNEALVYCIYVWQDESNADAILAVAISNFDSKITAGEEGDDDYVEYMPVEFGTESWDPNDITSVESSFDDMGNIIEIVTPMIAAFFANGHDTVDIFGNAFLEFIDTGLVPREEENPMREYDFVIELVLPKGVGCFQQILTKMVGFF